MLAERWPMNTRREMCSPSDRSTSSSLPSRTWMLSDGVGDIGGVGGIGAGAAGAIDQRGGALPGGFGFEHLGMGEIAPAIARAETGVAREAI
jgi:hypothetical protein